MRTTIRQRIEILDRIRSLGISLEHAEALRRISMTLQRWFELECGSDNGCIERDEKTGKPYWLNAHTGKRTHQMPDRELGAGRRLARIMEAYPELVPYIQTDCRGASLYVLRKSDVNGCDIEQVYTRGVAVY